MTKKTPRRIVAQPYDFSVQDLVDKVENGDIDVQPDYQRNYVWATNDEVANKRSRLIESLLLNIPIPVIYFAEQAETLKYEVIDGQQRLKTFQEFLKDGFALTKLEIRDDVNGKRYSELDQKDRDEIRKRSIRAIVVLNESDEEIKYEVFERLNLGSIQLTPQEIRNNTLRGPFNDLLKELAADKDFRALVSFKRKHDQTNMAHEELVLRFFAYHASGLKRTDQLSFFLTKFMREKRNLSRDALDELKKLFHGTVSKVKKYLGNDAFSIFQVKTGTWNASTNRVLYESQMLTFANLSEKDIVITPIKFKQRLRDLISNDEKFKKGLGGAAGGKKIEERVKSLKDLLTKK